MNKKVILAILIVVVLIAAGGGYSYYHFYNQTPSKQTKTSLVVAESEQPDSLDPAVTYSTPGWEIDNQIYQGLIGPNGTSDTSYVGVLAKSWTISNDLMNYTFNLRNNVNFSNGDPFNAYVMWYSLYRTLIMNQAPAWILGQNFNYSNGADFTVTANDLNTFNFTSPTSAQLSVMEYANQSFQVVNKYEIILHLGYGYNGAVPYTDLLATLITPMAAAVDPIVVNNNGGVTDGAPNSWMVTHAVGTGFYTLKSWIQGQSITMVKNTNYWADNMATSELNSDISPAILQTLTINYKSATAAIADLKSGAAQIIEAPTSDYKTVSNISGVNVSVLPAAFGSSQGAYFVYMDPEGPFLNLSVRQAVSYAIDYQGIINTVFGNLATQWVGPIPPGFPNYNASINGLSPYQYNATKAAELLAEAGYQATFPNNGTVLNKGGTAFPLTDFLYTSDSASETQVANILQSEFNAIGMNIKLTPLTFSQYQNVVWSYNTTQYYMGLNFYTEDYTASSDYVDALADGGYVGTSMYYNDTVFNLTVNATSTLNQQQQIQNYTQITNYMYNSYWFIWTYVPYFLSINQNNVVGMVPNAAGSGAGYFMYYNTVHYASST